jgi:hypothetical protein
MPRTRRKVGITRMEMRIRRMEESPLSDIKSATAETELL